jgi:hypothetical protein
MCQGIEILRFRDFCDWIRILIRIVIQIIVMELLVRYDFI